MTTITSDSTGNPDRFLAYDELCRALAALSGAPESVGRVVLIVRRREQGRREALQQSPFTPEHGVPGDAWISRGIADPAAQIAVMQADVARLIANGQPFELFGDNLFVDLNLSAANLPCGSRLRVGSVLMEVTAKPHNGCRKFRARFGADAQRFVVEPSLRHRNLRGIYFRVIEAGDVAVGDPVEVLARGS